MEKKAVINLETLLEICGGENSFIIEMIDLFLKQADTFIMEIEEACTNNNPELAMKKAHKFKSSAQIFGISSLSEMLIRIEADGLFGIPFLEKNAIFNEMREISDLACEQIIEARKKYC